MIEKYAEYSVEDFIKDDRFVDDTLSPNEQSRMFWHKLIVVYPHLESTVKQAKQLVIQLAEASGTQPQAGDSAEIWQGIREAIAEEPMEVMSERRLGRWVWMAAASVVILLGFGWLTYLSQTGEPVAVYASLLREAKAPLKEVVNKTGKTMTILLPDNSKVFLEKNSRLSYSESFSGHTRNVYLSGEAFFEVTRNPEKPFVVYANELVTKVLGTSFNVRAFDNDSQVTVAVKTGKVSVYANHSAANVDPETKGIILIPNQQASFERQSEMISRSLVEEPRIIIPRNELGKFTFTNAPVTQIFTAVEDAYGVDILYNEELLSSCRLTTSLSEETLFERLDVICEAIDATYKVVDAQVIITGKRCN